MKPKDRGSFADAATARHYCREPVDAGNVGFVWCFCSALEWCFGFLGWIAMKRVLLFTGNGKGKRRRHWEPYCAPRVMESGP